MEPGDYLLVEDTNPHVLTRPGQGMYILLKITCLGEAHNILIFLAIRQDRR